MNSSTTTNDEVASYAAAVRTAFADLEPDAREELLEDLEDHLREVAAEGDGSLADKLGSPATYAEELRTAAGLPPKATGELRRSLRAYVAGTAGAQWMRSAWAATMAHPAGRAVLAFLPDLRPAWWVLRGYLAVQLPCAMLIGMQSFPIPRILGSRVLGLIAVMAAVIASVALARHGTTTGRARVLLAGVNTVLAVFGLTAFLSLGTGATVIYQDDSGFVGAATGAGLRMDGREISNIYPFDAQGRPLHDVYLVDQAGNPLVASQYDWPYSPFGPQYDPSGASIPQQLAVHPDRDSSGNDILHKYPQRQTVFDPSGGERPVPVPQFVPPVVASTNPGPSQAPTTVPPTTGGPATSAPSSTAPATTAPPTTSAPPTTRR